LVLTVLRKFAVVSFSLYVCPFNPSKQYEKDGNTDSYWDLILNHDELTRLYGPEDVSKLESNANAMRLQSNVEEAKS